MALLLKWPRPAAREVGKQPGFWAAIHSSKNQGSEGKQEGVNRYWGH